MFFSYAHTESWDREIPITQLRTRKVLKASGSSQDTYDACSAVVCHVPSHKSQNSTDVLVVSSHVKRRYKNFCLYLLAW